MAMRRHVLLLACPLLGGCVSDVGTGDFPSASFGFAGMPSWSEVAADVEAGAMRFVPAKAEPAPVVPVVRREASEIERLSVLEAVRASMSPGLAPAILVSKSGTDASGRLLTCGLASGTDPDGGRGWSGMFLVETDPVTAASRIVEIGDGFEQMSIHSDCKERGLA